MAVVAVVAVSQTIRSANCRRSCYRSRESGLLRSVQDGDGDTMSLWVCPICDEVHDLADVNPGWDVTGCPTCLQETGGTE